MDSRFFGLAVLLLLVLASQEGSIETEAKMCETPSGKFRGVCVLDRNCLATCEGEGFADGKCGGFRKRCICYKPCDADNTSPPN